MRIPPFHRSPTWQRFFAGAALGGLISWVIFFYMYGVQQETQIRIIHDQREEIKDLNEEIAIWEQEYKKLNQQNEEILTIQEVEVTITNGKYSLDRLSIAEAEDVIEDDLSSLLAKDIVSVYNGKMLLKKSIENKIVDINKKRYKLEVVEIMFYTKMNIEIKLKRTTS
ncbi:MULTISPECIES: sporulation membrane protein YtrI [Peribacillus]|uniref:sporulation membrane protein YtrI n=1 Tax=Peribacillus TaxID=2675229 RepID=UPI001911C141|nr:MULTISPECIES: sporulation membrane protein YtrI [unclassified Peribacillus]MBK5442925.1 sporulation protein [Peribacillus sp. TH24]MBK5462336.1 sporulation protein [Peribacillus sp. TH27]MBK5484327.1 sporulation protein [Peribacillus sp. TH16]MBK5500486.1 sporulation protein [Peribacillus sp. TH14]WMX54483.1 sporulation protein [Peribacillus sp. R9-11]